MISLRTTIHILPRVFTVWVFTWIAGFATAQLNGPYLKAYLENQTQNKNWQPAALAQLQRFYAQLDYEPVWFNPGNTLLAQSMFRLIAYADYEGLDPRDYHDSVFANFISHSLHAKSTSDSADVELLLSISAIDFFTGLKYGNIQPTFGYKGFQTHSTDTVIPLLVAQHVKKRAVLSLYREISPRIREIDILTSTLSTMLDREQKLAGWDPVVNSPEVSYQNVPLVIKLFRLGLLDNPDEKFEDTLLVKKLRHAQRLLCLAPDGKIGKETFSELNTPVSKRIACLRLSVNYYRWLANLSDLQPVIVVNIPSAGLSVYSRDSVLLTMRMIVGKPSTPTPTLTGIVNKLVLYPYWTVPKSIATKELLPVFKRDPDYVRNGNFQVLSGNGRLIDARSINWHSYSRTNFPFTIRQSTGCDNALGLLKLDFENPYGVYLHDTPLKILFAARNRFMSHGCMRMEKPMEMGRMLLGNDTRAIDTLTEKGCLRNQSPVIVPAVTKMPVVVWYNPVGIDTSGAVIFYKDIYRKLEEINE